MTELDEVVAASPISNGNAKLYLSQVWHSDLFKNIGETFGVRIFLIASGLIFSILIARTLGPEGRGALAAAITICGLGSQLGNLGLHASNTYFIAKDRTLLSVLIGNSLLVSVGMGTGIGIIILTAFLVWPQFAPVHGTLLFLALLWIPFDLINMLLQNLLLGIYEIRSYNLVQVIGKALNIVLLSLLLLLRWVTVEAAMFISVVGLVISSCWAFARLNSFLSHPIRPELRILNDHLGYGIKAYFAGLFGFLVLRIDLLIVQYVLGSEQLGYYSLAVTIADMIYMLPVIVGTLLFPKLSAMASNADRLKVAHRVAGMVLLVMLVALLPIYPAASIFVKLLYGAEFQATVPALLYLLPGIVLLSVNTIYMNYFASTGMPLINVYSPAAGAVLNIVLNAIFTPRFGIVGTSVASTFAYGFMLILSLAFIWNHRKSTGNGQLSSAVAG